MTQEDKNLLLKDLCARLPYGVKIAIHGSGKLILRNVINSSIGWYVDAEGAPTDFSIDEVKPYLRPMSSMTEEEIKTYRTLQDTACSYHYEFGDIVDDFLYFDNDVSLDYLNSIHIDYRGLIPMGIAIEAKEGMYKNE